MKRFELLDIQNKMMKLVPLALFIALCSAFSPLFHYGHILTSNGSILFYEYSPATFICKKTHAIWKVDGKKVNECNCTEKCGDVLLNETRITAFCNESSPKLHFEQMELADNFKTLKCSDEKTILSDIYDFRLLVGRTSNDFYPKEPFALIDNTYTLVCEKKTKFMVYYLYDDTRNIARVFSGGHMEVEDGENFTFTQDQSKITILIKKIVLEDDEKIFGCYSQDNGLSLLNLKVNVPVSHVSLYQKNNGDLIEDETEIFVCKVDNSKPEPTFQWFLFENGLEREITQNINIASELNEKLWQTTSTLKLKLKRNFKTIKCRARIERLAWKNSTSLPLDVKYPPEGNPTLTVSNPRVCVGEQMKITCQWEGGHPRVSLTLNCLSKTKTKQNYVVMTENVSREMSHHCDCEGVHVAGNVLTKRDLIIQYPPNKVVIRQTSYLKGNPSSLICDVSGGSPDVYTYSWSPGNYSNQKEININLTQVIDQEFICTVAYQKCGRGYIKSSPTKIIVEDYPIIKMNRSIAVVEYERIELDCISEGNPEPTNSWRIGNKIINSRLLKTSFTRQNASSDIECIAIANSSKHGILKTVQNISINVTLIKRSDDDNIDIVVILAPTIAVLIIIISGVIFYFKYRSYSMKKKAANKIPPLPTRTQFMNKKAARIFTRPTNSPKSDDEATENNYDEIKINEKPGETEESMYADVE